jgi:SAM-dependent methyltransferase
MDKYWEEVWRNPDLSEYRGYINGHLKAKREFVKIFKKYNIRTVCDAACGFGAYSAMLSANGFQTAGFDVADSSVKLTRELLDQLQINSEDYIVSDITDINFSSGRFDAVVAHSVIDHLPAKAAKKARMELLRIIKDNGLLYLSFDGLEEDDINLSHQVLEDGSFLYTDESRKGLLFKFYEEQDTNTYFQLYYSDNILNQYITIT